MIEEDIKKNAKTDPVLTGLKFLSEINRFSTKDQDVCKKLAESEHLTKEEFDFAKKILKRYEDKLPPELFVDILNAKFTGQKTEKPKEDDIPKTIPPDIYVLISNHDRISASIWNGHEGKIDYVVTKENDKGEDKDWIYTLVRFDGSIDEPLLINGTTHGLRFHLGKDEYVLSVADAVRLFKDIFYLQSLTCQRLSEVFTYYVSNAEREGKLRVYMNSPISVVDGIVRVDYDIKGKTKEILSLLREYENIASHREAYRATFAWALFAPLHYYLKSLAKSNLKCPLILESGKTSGGKTSIANLFIGHGYDMPKEKYFYPFNRVQSLFMLSVHLSESNIPAIIDDVTVKWITQNKENFKSYVHSGIFADRGKSNQQHSEYSGMRSFIMTLNEDYAIDMDLALASRMGVFSFGPEESRRTNREKYLELLKTLPTGFMYELFVMLFKDRRIDEIVHEVEPFETTNDWFNYILRKVNELCTAFGVEPFPLINGDSKASSVSYAMDIAQAFLAEWARMHDYGEKSYNGEVVRVQKYYSQLSMELDVDELNGRTFIHFTPGAFKKLIQMRGFEKIYASTTEFINNIDSREDGVMVMNDGKRRTHRFGESVLHAYTISIPTETVSK